MRTLERPIIDIDLIDYTDDAYKLYITKRLLNEQEISMQKIIDLNLGYLFDKTLNKMIDKNLIAIKETESGEVIAITCHLEYEVMSTNKSLIDIYFGDIEIDTSDYIEDEYFTDSYGVKPPTDFRIGHFDTDFLEEDELKNTTIHLTNNLKIRKRA